MSNALDKDTEAILSSLESFPKPNQVVNIGDKSAAAGGRAGARRTKPPGSRLNQQFTDTEQAAFDQEDSERQQVVASDLVVQTSKAKDSLALLSAIKAEIALEAANLAYQRIKSERDGKDITMISARRIEALKKMSDIEMEMRKIGFEQIDVRGEKFQRIFMLFVEMVREAAEESLSSETLDIFFNKLTTKMDGWEEKAEEVIG